MRIKSFVPWVILAALVAGAIFFAGLGVRNANAAQMKLLRFERRSVIYPGLTMQICVIPAHAIDFSQLRWFHHQAGSVISEYPGRPDCITYNAPGVATGWDRVSVNYRGATASVTFSVLPAPPRP